MGEYTEECINTFLEKQGQLFPQPVAESYEAAEAFLEDCMAAVVNSIAEVRVSGRYGSRRRQHDGRRTGRCQRSFRPAGWNLSDRRGIRQADKSNLRCYAVLYRIKEKDKV